MIKRPFSIPMISRTVVVLIMAGIFALCQSDTTPKKAGAAESKQVEKAQMKDTPSGEKLIVYYFRTTFRCHSCHFIEETTRKTIEESFANEINSGRMVFKMINVEEKGNGHYIEEYKLYTKSVILSDTKGGKETRWTNLDKVWQLIGNKQGFKEYIVKEVKAYLGV